MIGSFNIAIIVMLVVIGRELTIVKNDVKELYKEMILMKGPGFSCCLDTLENISSKISEPWVTCGSPSSSHEIKFINKPTGEIHETQLSSEDIGKSYW
jgi:hypothetical protein